MGQNDRAQSRPVFCAWSALIEDAEASGSEGQTRLVRDLFSTDFPCGGRVYFQAIGADDPPGPLLRATESAASI